MPRSPTVRQLHAEGADILDIGGESTRPGATRPLVAEELDRVVPVIRALARDGIAVSVDTMRHEVAAAALEAGAVLVNDVSGGLADPRVLDVVAEHGAAYVVMHWRAHSDRDAAARDVRRRARRGPRRARPATRGGRGGGRRRGPARRRPGTRLRQDRRPQLGAAPAAARARVARRPDPGRARAASRSSGPCWPAPTAAPVRCSTARTPTWRSPRSPRSRASGGCGCTRCAPAWTRSGWSAAGSTDRAGGARIRRSAGSGRGGRPFRSLRGRR